VGARTGSIEFNVLVNLSYLNLIQFNLIYNRSGSLLDLVLSNVVNEDHMLLPLDSMYHLALTIELHIFSFKYLNYNEQIYDFFNCDYNCIRSGSCFARLEWHI
jgi:hypothetical protein